MSAVTIAIPAAPAVLSLSLDLLLLSPHTHSGTALTHKHSRCTAVTTHCRHSTNHNNSPPGTSMRAPSR